MIKSIIFGVSSFSYRVECNKCHSIYVERKHYVSCCPKCGTKEHVAAERFSTLSVEDIAENYNVSTN